MARFTKLGYVALNVTDLERSRRFYEDLVGLEVSEIGPGGEVFLRCNNDHHSVILYQSDTPGLKRIGFELESEAELRSLCSGLGERNIAVDAVDADEAAALGQGPTYRLTEPNTGTRLELYASMRTYAGRPYVPTVAKIQRLGHVVLACAAYQATIDFFRDVFGFRISDSIDGRVTFMRCYPNPYHHGLGFINASQNGLQHINFMVSEIDDIGKGLWRFKKNDVEVVYGPGRHPPSGSIFLYFLDPDEIRVEYSFGMEEFPETGARKERVLPPVPESSDFWGGPHPLSNLKAIETA